MRINPEDKGLQGFFLFTLLTLQSYFCLDFSDLCNVPGKSRQILCFFTLFCYKGLAQIEKKEYNTYKQVL